MESQTNQTKPREVITPVFPQLDGIDALFDESSPIDVPRLELDGFTVDIGVVVDGPEAFTELLGHTPPKMPSIYLEGGGTRCMPPLCLRRCR